MAYFLQVQKKTYTKKRNQILFDKLLLPQNYPNNNIQNVILKNPTGPEIYQVARKNGMLTMQEDAIMKSLNGIIPFSEVYGLSSE